MAPVASFRFVGRTIRWPDTRPRNRGGETCSGCATLIWNGRRDRHCVARSPLPRGPGTPKEKTRKREGAKKLAPGQGWPRLVLSVQLEAMPSGLAALLLRFRNRALMRSAHSVLQSRAAKPWRKAGKSETQARLRSRAAKANAARTSRPHCHFVTPIVTRTDFYNQTSDEILANYLILWRSRDDSNIRPSV
jgi:hypothetical protein